ncbi:MAG: hypothetical protein V2B19_00375 [Pseudomonadota bacterium]
MMMISAIFKRGLVRFPPLLSSPGIDVTALIIVPATPGYFSRTGRNCYRSDSLPLFQKHPGAACLPWEIGRNDDQGRCDGEKRANDPESA